MMKKMISLRQKILTNGKQCKGSAKAILWPLVLYSLMQIFANLKLNDSTRFQDSNHNPSSYQTTTTTTKTTTIPATTSATTTKINSNLRPQQEARSQKSCSSLKEISSSAKPLLSSSYLSLLHFFNQDNGRSFFGGKILMAEASAVPHLPHQDKGIIVLNSTNFNTELIQYKHPFPHIKLIEYYVSFCKFCAKFKETTYSKLAKEIHTWRNVIRPSAIDLGVSNNSPIAHSWSVETVPTLRIHPPPSTSLGEKLNKQLSAWNSTLSSGDLQKSMFAEYNSSRLMMQSLDVTHYMNKVPLLKSDLLLYIERYVRENPTELPATWPNLKSVTEASLVELQRNHPRHELFLIIEGPTTGTSAYQSSGRDPSLGLNVIMELSSSAAWRAVRYVRASENKALIEDVIAQHKKASEMKGDQSEEHAKLLNRLLSEQESGGNNILLVHIDDSHSSQDHSGPSLAFPHLTLVTGTDLVSMEQSVHIEHSDNYNTVKRSIDHHGRARRSLLDTGLSVLNGMSSERIVELVTLYVKQTYIETSEDREFVRAINNFDEDPRAHESFRKDARKFIKAQNAGLEKSNTSQEQSELIANDQVSLANKIMNIFNPPEKRYISEMSSQYASDYDDKLKAIRYMLFNEIPRTSTIDKTLVEQQEILNTLVDLISVIKAYFPLPDSASIQFIDEVQSYLKKQQSRLSSINTADRIIPGFDTRAFKQELKRLEREDKRLPEVKEWRYCEKSGYPCALWRLFHTLTAFEYKKLSQIRQPTQQQPSSPSLQPLSTSSPQSKETNFLPSSEAITLKSTNSIDPLSPVERLVSPPSTTTSLSLTIATSAQSQESQTKNKPLTEADLPTPVILVMRNYITTFFSCAECVKNFRTEAADLSLERIRQHEPAEFSILWLWETHNRVNKRLSVDPATNPVDRPKVWFPSYNQCSTCYRRPPSFLHDPTVDSKTKFYESIDWNRQEVLCFLLREFSKQPMDNYANIFGYQIPYGFWYIILTCICCMMLIFILRCTTVYVERQRRHKASLMNGATVHYNMELQ